MQSECRHNHSSLHLSVVPEGFIIPVLSFYNVQTCIAGSLGAGDSQILQEGMGGLLTGGPPPLLLLPYLL